ncbi:MAG: PAS domain-containing protein [Opitutae bacterium]|nr:PAS domain-containing protein [Opitutae bacterium]
MTPRSLTFSEYKTLVEQSPILIWRADLTMGCDYFNERWLAFTGRTMEQEFGNGWAVGVHADDLDRCLQIYTDSFAARKVFTMEYRLRRHDGAFRWISDHGEPFYDEKGQFAGYIGSCVDVTERVEAQDALVAAHEAEVKTLHGLLPICSACKKIRDKQGRWTQIETYIKQRSEADFTHGICPDCAKVYYPDADLTGHDTGR